MIITENITINGKEFIKTYSDLNFQIRKIGTNEIYDDVYDLPDKNYTYEETDMEIVIPNEIIEV